MHPIRTPEVLDPDRILDNDRGNLTVDHEARAQLLAKGLRESCAYAQQLWNTLTVARTYLYDSLPSDPRAPGQHPRLSAAPTGPDDTEGWDRWVDVYGGVTAVLCGPRGDSGFGVGEARDAARLRRTAPNVKIVAEHPDVVAGPSSEGTTADPPPARPGGSALRTVALVATAAVLGRLLAPRRRAGG